MTNETRSNEEMAADYEEAIRVMDGAMAKVMGGYTMKFFAIAVGMDADGDLVYQSFMPKDQMDADAIGLLRHATIITEHRVLANHAINLMHQAAAEEDDEDLL